MRQAARLAYSAAVANALERYVLSGAVVRVHTERVDGEDPRRARVSFEVDADALAPFLEAAHAQSWRLADLGGRVDALEPREEAAALRRYYMHGVVAALDECIEAEGVPGLATHRTGYDDSVAEITFRVHGEAFARIMDRRGAFGL